jgi:hypothetical protein
MVVAGSSEQTVPVTPGTGKARGLRTLVARVIRDDDVAGSGPVTPVAAMDDRSRQKGRVSQSPGPSCTQRGTARAIHVPICDLMDATRRAETRRQVSALNTRCSMLASSHFQKRPSISRPRRRMLTDTPPHAEET